MFVLDTSYSQTNDTVDIQKQLVQEIIREVIDDKQTFQFSLVSVGYDTSIHFFLNTHNETESLIASIDTLTHESGPTYTGKALEIVKNEVLKSSNGARFINTFVVVFSDGLSSDPLDTIVRANELKQNGVIVIAVGIGTQIYHEQLLHIASDQSKVLSQGNNDLLNTFLYYHIMDVRQGRQIYLPVFFLELQANLKRRFE